MVLAIAPGPAGGLVVVRRRGWLHLHGAVVVATLVGGAGTLIGRLAAFNRCLWGRLLQRPGRIVALVLRAAGLLIRLATLSLRRLNGLAGLHNGLF